MEDKYFDDKIKDILESPPTYEVEGASMADMQSRLRMAKAGPRKRNAVGIIIPFLILSFLAAAVYFFQKFESLNQELNQLKNQFSEINIETQTQNIITYQYDTIYNVIYKEKYVLVDQPVASMPEQHYGLNFPYLLPKQTNQVNASKMNFTWSPGNTGLSLLNKMPGSSFFESSTIPKQEVLPTPAKELNFLDLLTLEQLRTNEISEEEVESKLKQETASFKKKKVKPIAYITPTGWSVRGNYNPTAWMQNEYGSTGRVFGISSAIDLPKNRSIEIGAEYFGFDLSFNPDALPNIPIAAPNAPSDALGEAKARMACIQIPLNIRQLFFEKSAIQPMLSTGIVAAIPIQQEFTYEYRTGTDEYYKSVNANNGNFSIDNFRFGLGAQYALWKNISVESEFQYQHGSSKDETALFPIRYWSFRFGLNYKL